MKQLLVLAGLLLGFCAPAAAQQLVPGQETLRRLIESMQQGHTDLNLLDGGDVKLLTALALWIAPALFLKLVIMMALLGGVLTLIFGAWHVMRRQREKLAIPYGVAIAMAGLWVLGTNYLPPTVAAGGVG